MKDHQFHIRAVNFGDGTWGEFYDDFRHEWHQKSRQLRRKHRRALKQYKKTIRRNGW